MDGRKWRKWRICQSKHCLGEHWRRWTDENDENDELDEFVKANIFLESIVEDRRTKMTNKTNLSQWNKEKTGFGHFRSGHLTFWTFFEWDKTDWTFSSSSFFKPGLRSDKTVDCSFFDPKTICLFVIGLSWQIRFWCSETNDFRRPPVLFISQAKTDNSLNLG